MDECTPGWDCARNRFLQRKAPLLRTSQAGKPGTPLGVPQVNTSVSPIASFRERRWTTSRFVAPIIIIALLGLLTSCGSNSPRPQPSETPGPLVEVNLTLAGAPLQRNGQLELTSVVVQVHDDSGTLVRFGSDNVIHEDGEHEHLIVPAGDASVALFLNEGVTWTFTGHAFDAADNLLAFAEAQRTTAAGSSNATALRFTSLLGMARLETRLPTRQLLPGQEIDLLLRVTPRERPDLSVPTLDYHASYETVNGANLHFSERGVRVRVGDQAGGDLVVTGRAAGLLWADGLAVPGDVSATLRLPFGTSLGVDLEAPVLSNLAFDAEQQIFTGVADDNYGVVQLELYDGPVLLASTDPEVMSAKHVPEVVFPGGGTAFHSRITLPAGEYTLTVVATDFSGHEARARHEVSVP